MDAQGGGRTPIDCNRWVSPIFPKALNHLGKVYLATGRFAEAIEVFARARDDGGLGHAYGVAGRTEEARAMLARLEQQAREHYVPPYSFALVHVGLGNVSEALDTLERGFAIRDPGMSGIKLICV